MESISPSHTITQSLSSPCVPHKRHISKLLKPPLPKERGKEANVLLIALCLLDRIGMRRRRRQRWRRPNDSSAVLATERDAANTAANAPTSRVESPQTVFDTSLSLLTFAPFFP